MCKTSLSSSFRQTHSIHRVKWRADLTAHPASSYSLQTSRQSIGTPQSVVNVVRVTTKTGSTRRVIEVAQITTGRLRIR